MLADLGVGRAELIELADNAPAVSEGVVRLVARRWKKIRPDFDFRLWKGGTKGTLIGTRRGRTVRP